MIRTLKKIVILEHLDTHSNHTWRYEIDFIKPQIDIFKNDEWKRTVHCVEHPIRDAWLLEMREGL